MLGCVSLASLVFASPPARKAPGAGTSAAGATTARTGRTFVKLTLIIPAGMLLIGGLSACSTAPATAPAGGGQQAPAAGAQTQDREADETGKPEEEPLTGELKEKAEAAALKEYPGEVKKSEHDVERPGLYAVEIEQESGEEVEVYLDKEFNVVGTKDESGETDGD